MEKKRLEACCEEVMKADDDAKKIADIISYHEKLSDEIARSGNSVIDRIIDKFIDGFETEEEKEKAINFLFLIYLAFAISSEQTVPLEPQRKDERIEDEPIK